MLPSLVEMLIESGIREDHVDIKAFCEALGVTNSKARNQKPV
jgi:hypothetical protein